MDHFCPFTPPSPPPPPHPLSNKPENQNFEKIKNIPEGIIILHMCTINENYMVFIFHFGLFFALLPP